MLKTRLIFLLCFISISITDAYSSPFQVFKNGCHNLIQKMFSGKKNFSGPDYTPPEASHPSHLEVINELQSSEFTSKKFFHLPKVEQSIEQFSNTNGKYLRYYFDSAANNSVGRREFLENTAEIVYTPHASYHGHVRLRIGNKLYGFENVKRTMNSTFDGSALYKAERKVKKGRKEGNLGVVFTLTEAQQQVLKERQGMIDQFYDSSARYNIPPFDGSGAAEVKVLVDEATGRMSYKSPTSKSSFGNHAEITGSIVEENGAEFLVSPNGFRHPIHLNEKGERVVKSFSCASSVHHVMDEILGMSVKEMPYAGSFMTSLKNGAQDHLSPDAIIHYYPSIDL